MSKLLETFQELNLSNYGPDDVDQLNAWAIDAYAELSAIKAQEPAFMWHKGATEDESEVVDVDCACPCCVPLYAAPVHEAKAQGVVMPPSPYMPGSQPTDFTDYELGEIHGRIAMWEEVKRLNAAHVQQVSVPDASTDFSQFLSAVMDAAGLVRHGRRSKELSEYLGSKCMEYRGFAAPAAPAADAGVTDHD